MPRSSADIKTAVFNIIIHIITVRVVEITRYMNYRTDLSKTDIFKALIIRH